MQDVDSLQKVWEVNLDWNRNWSVWKVGQFATLQTEDMESTTQEMFKRLQKLQRELKVCSANTQTDRHNHKYAIVNICYCPQPRNIHIRLLEDDSEV